MDKKLRELLNNEIAELAKEKFARFAKDAIKDASAFLQDTENDFKKWSVALAAGEIPKEEFDWLIKSKKDRAKMGFLTKKGIAEIEIDKFRDAIIDLVFKKLL